MEWSKFQNHYFCFFTDVTNKHILFNFNISVHNEDGKDIISSTHYIRVNTFDCASHMEFGQQQGRIMHIIAQS